MRSNRIGMKAWLGLTILLAGAAPASAQVKPGDVITKENAAKVQNLLSPGNYILVQQGMRLDIVPAEKLEWPPPFKAATEKYSSQVALAPDGSLKGYVSGQPFPLLDPNDPQIATKIMWNFSFRPMYSDDADLRYPEVASFAANSNGSPLGYFTVGHFAFYNNVGRIEVPPVPTDPDAAASGIRYRFGFYPFLEPATLRGFGLVRYRHINPNEEDNTWLFNPVTRKLRRQSAAALTDAIGMLPGFGGTGSGTAGFSGVAPGSPATAYASTFDPDSYFGFAAKIEDYNYRYLGDKQMLASVHAKNSPSVACPSDGGRTICPENWEMRHLYAVEANAKPGKDVSIPKRILYLDSEGWFITASDQYDRDGKLWKTLVTYHTYRDRPVPDARVAIYPYKRIFQLGLVDEDVNSGMSSVIYMPGPTSEERECWYIDMGVVTNHFFMPQTMENAGH
ncbi:MAG TPA: DUF1329 domain-containing protein [Candidatus Binataceae bacterium]|nr:DUF1329 domain-containing protein [Candidatus Binataceae bacterium]